VSSWSATRTFIQTASEDRLDCDRQAAIPRVAPISKDSPGKRRSAESPGLAPTAATARGSDSRARAISPEPGAAQVRENYAFFASALFSAQRFFVAAMIALLPAAESLRLGLGAAAEVEG
jgi:hypothetical protein